MGNNIYFISDVHLGLHPEEKSMEREKKLVSWLQSIKNEAAEIYFMGDIFDFWHEYKRVVPRGFTRFLGTVSLMADSGIKIHFFPGNHDVWMYSYLEKECGAVVHRKQKVRELGGKKFFLHHGDGLGPGDMGFKLLRKAFHSKFLQWCFARLHPNFAMWLGLTWSKKSRYAKGIIAEGFAGFDKEYQVLFARDVLKHNYYDYFIFGHRHIPSEITLEKGAKLVNLGDWIYSFTYGVWDGNQFMLKQCEGKGDKILRLSVE